MIAAMRDFLILLVVPLIITEGEFETHYRRHIKGTH